MSLLSSLLALALLHLLLPDVQGFTVEITQADIPGLEGDQLQVTVRLEGQIFGDVSVELHLLTLPQFLDRPEAPQGYTLSEDPAESDDFSHDDDLQHTFHAVSVVRQTVDFNIDIVDDSTNEKKEQFIVLVDEPTIANQEEDFYEPDDSDRLFAVVTINIDPDYPDKTQLRISAPPGGSSTVSEGVTGWFLSLTVEAFLSEDDIEVNVVAEGTSNNPAIQGDDYNIPVTSVMLTSAAYTYSVAVEIMNDNIPEPRSESLQVSFSVEDQDRVQFLPRSSITITIEDNDGLTIGFSPPELVIREGESVMARLFIMSPAQVQVSVSGAVAHAGGRESTAHGPEIPSSQAFSLSQSNREYEFLVSIPQNDDINRAEREFSLAVQDRESLSSLVTDSPMYLRVVIKDNDTNVEVGIRDVSQDTPKQVVEGGSFTFTVGFLDDKVLLDDDFVLGYSLKITSNDVATNFVTADISDGILTNTMRSRDITIETKSNSEVEENRVFFINMEITTDFHPVSLVKLGAGSAGVTVIIIDDDISSPIKPTVNTVEVANVDGGRGFEISWTDNSSKVQPVDSYRVEITFPALGRLDAFTIPIDDVDSKTNFQHVPYKQKGVDYTTANITVAVCAINGAGETCSDTVFHKGSVSKGASGSGGGGLSDGGIAAIVIVLLLLVCIAVPLILFLLFLCRLYCWKSYYPPIREKKNSEEIMEARNMYYEVDA